MCFFSIRTDFLSKRQAVWIVKRVEREAMERKGLFYHVVAAHGTN